MTETPQTVLEFWFSDLTPKDWFVKSEDIDGRIAERFTALHLALSREVTAEWRASLRATRPDAVQ